MVHEESALLPDIFRFVTVTTDTMLQRGESPPTRCYTDESPSYIMPAETTNEKRPCARPRRTIKLTALYVTTEQAMHWSEVDDVYLTPIKEELWCGKHSNNAVRRN